MNLSKKTIIILYTLIIVCIACATVIEKYRGTAFVSEHIYGAWWFSALWAVLTVASLAYIMGQRLYKRLAVFLLHISFVVILAGALTTHLFARRGSVRLRTNIPEYTFIDQEKKVIPLPFTLTLKEFRIVNYPGTDAPLDYQSVIHYSPLEEQEGAGEVLVSMNNIGHISGYRFFQSTYDSDGEGVTLGVSYDPYGIAITYTGYLLLLIGIIATLLSRHTQMRALYRKMAVLCFIFHSSWCAAAPQSVSPDIAHRMGSIHVLYNNRICPLNTVATDFVTKLTGSATWQGYSADEIFFSWMIYYSPWEQQKLIRVKSREVRQLLGIDSQWASYSDFLNEYQQYKLQDAVEALRRGHSTMDKKALMDADEKYHLIEMFYRGQFTRIFPYPDSLSLKDSQVSAVSWYSPGGQSLPRAIPVKEQFFIKQSMDFLTECIVTGQRDRALEIIAKIKLFQRDMIGDLLPSENATKAELFYNTLRSQKWPVFLALTLSLLFTLIMFKDRLPKNCAAAYHYSFFIIHGSLLSYVSLQLALRWWLSGHIPVSNGPETMLFMAWVLLLLPILNLFLTPHSSLLTPHSSVLNHHSSLLIPQSSFFLASFCLLVAMLGGSSSQITPLMPVLQSPLLSVHVMTVMCAYALFALQTLLGIHAFILMRKSRNQPSSSPISHSLDRVTALSQFLLYPAVFLLTIGIFLGAVWANVSWGNYWSWDPKETWALITLMIYAVPFHRSIFTPSRLSTTRPFKHFFNFQSPNFQSFNISIFLYHLYIVCAFLSVIITYFGVNYLLGGMHSYA